METKLITKTIKELADEYDGNVDQLHRTISGYEQLTKDQKKEIEYLKTENSYARYDAGLERSARARAETNAEASIFIMFTCVASMFVLLAKNILNILIG